MARLLRLDKLLKLTSAVLLLAVSCSGDGSPNGEEQNQGVPVTVANAVTKDVPVQVNAIGNVEAYSIVEIKPQVAGELSQVYFKEGEYVSEGEPLFLIDRRPFENALRQAEANMARNTALLKKAEQDALRYEDLIQKGVVSAQQYDQVRAEYESLKAAVTADKAAVGNARLELEYCSIKSPIDGRIGEILVHKGNTVEQRSTLLAVINQIRPVYVDFSVPEHFLPEIRSYMADYGELAVYARLPMNSQSPGGEGPEDANPSLTTVNLSNSGSVAGKLSFIDNKVNETTGTIMLKALFQNEDEMLWPGKFVNVSVNLTTQKNAVLIPAAAVQSGQEGDYVFVVKADSTVESRPVVPGVRVDREIVILKGIGPGERVVTEGQLRLAPGMKVKPRDNTQSGPSNRSDLSMK